MENDLRGGVGVIGVAVPENKQQFSLRTVRTFFFQTLI